MFWRLKIASSSSFFPLKPNVEQFKHEIHLDDYDKYNHK